MEGGRDFRQATLEAGATVQVRGEIFKRRGGERERRSVMSVVINVAGK